MYPAICYAGYPVPMPKKGNVIVAVRATIADTTKASRLTLLDDAAINKDSSIGIIRASTWTGNTKIIDLKGVAGVHGELIADLEEPIKVRNAVSIVNADNLVAGSIFVYVR